MSAKAPLRGPCVAEAFRHFTLETTAGLCLGERELAAICERLDNAEVAGGVREAMILAAAIYALLRSDGCSSEEAEATTLRRFFPNPDEESIELIKELFEIAAPSADAPPGPPP